ncbi:(Fe-S)-binding protein, partial [Candidatus Poribacteria bacterium]|nr:(Fe-S)-binding protein [Candidatus Poribacteria bacterium]
MAVSFMDQITREKQEFIERCKSCGKCLEKCRIRPFSNYAAGVPAELRKAQIDFLKGGEFSQMLYDMAFSCIGCHYCSDACEHGLDPSRMGAISRIELVTRGQDAPPTYSFALPGEHFNYFSILSALLLNPSQTRWMTRTPESPQHADVVYFPGCGLHVSPDRLFTSLDILDRMGLNYVALGGIAHCCGVPYMAAGKGTECGERRDRLVESISAFTPKTAVMICPGCTMRLAGNFAAPSELPFRPMHFAAFLGENLDRLRFEKSIDKTVAIHDPCKLGRGLGEFEGVRKVLGAIPGLRVVEMRHWGKNTLCCSGSASMSYPKAAKELGLVIMEEAKETGADLLVDLCLGCHRALRGLSKDYPFEVVSFVTLVGRAMGIEYEDKLSLYLKWRNVDRVISDARANIAASSYS